MEREEDNVCRRLTESEHVAILDMYDPSVGTKSQNLHSQEGITLYCDFRGEFFPLFLFLQFSVSKSPTSQYTNCLLALFSILYSLFQKLFFGFSCKSTKQIISQNHMQTMITLIIIIIINTNNNFLFNNL